MGKQALVRAGIPGRTSAVLILEEVSLVAAHVREFNGPDLVTANAETSSVALARGEALLGIAVVLLLVAINAPAICIRSNSGNHGKKGDNTGSEMHRKEGGE